MSNPIQVAARKLPIVPHHEVSETLADQVGAIMFDGSTLKIDFAAVRLGAALPPATTAGERHVVARLVLPPGDARRQRSKYLHGKNSKRLRRRLRMQRKPAFIWVAAFSTDRHSKVLRF